MQFTSLALPILSILALVAAHPSPSSDLMTYPADNTIEMVKREQEKARCNPACPCVWFGMTIYCQCNC
ncbi:hypothetical protein GQ44DRAFT_604098 [Phaeosphaeriaceae sp. PMI808]|nr:hypothetical protein GQ44DRAFT_604098 [Phaeosphaeriaceae sp. PMI808]